MHILFFNRHYVIIKYYIHVLPIAIADLQTHVHFHAHTHTHTRARAYLLTH
jgi:hypothetical protein